MTKSKRSKRKIFAIVATVAGVLASTFATAQARAKRKA